MKTNKRKKISALLAVISGVFVMISCQPEYEADFVTYPDITMNSISPASGYPGSVVTITGSNFGNFHQAARIRFNGVLATEFESYADNVMEVRVPVEAQSGKVSVQVWTHLKDSVASYTVIPLPKIQSVVSSSEFGENIVLPGDIITITGSGFGPDASRLSIALGGVAAEVISVQDTKIEIEAPQEFPTGVVEVTIDGEVTIAGDQVLINPTAGGDITPYFLQNYGAIDSVQGQQDAGRFNFVRNSDAVVGRWGTLGEPWITNAGAKNKLNGDGVRVGGFATDAGGKLCFETWQNVAAQETKPIVDGKVYQQTGLELPAGDYTLSIEYFSEVNTNSSVYLVAAAGNGLPSLPDLGTALGSLELWNDTPVGATTPNLWEMRDLNFSIDTPQKVSIGILANITAANPAGGYFIVSGFRLVKN